MLIFALDWFLCSLNVFIDMCGLAMAISWSEIQKEESASWQTRKSDGVCTLLGCGWPRRRSIASFSLGLANVTRIMGNVLTSMIPLKSQSAPNFLVGHAPILIANWLTRYYHYYYYYYDVDDNVLKAFSHAVPCIGHSWENARLLIFFAR